MRAAWHLYWDNVLRGVQAREVRHRSLRLRSRSAELLHRHEKVCYFTRWVEAQPRRQHRSFQIKPEPICLNLYASVEKFENYPQSWRDSLRYKVRQHPDRLRGRLWGDWSSLPEWRRLSDNVCWLWRVQDFFKWSGRILHTKQRYWQYKVARDALIGHQHQKRPWQVWQEKASWH